MKIYVPFFNELSEVYANHPAVFFYNSLIILPELCGGRGLFDIAKTGFSNWKIFKKVSEQFGPRFQLLANSTSPRYSRKVKEACYILEKNKASITVSQIKFAEQLKNDFPTLTVNASCIMSLYIPFKEVLKSDLFVEVCAPQFWNYNIADMCKAVPTHERNRVYYIINSPCVWTRHCRLHYEELSKSYQNILNYRQLIAQKQKQNQRQNSGQNYINPSIIKSDKINRPLKDSIPAGAVNTQTKKAPLWKKTCQRQDVPWGVGVWGKGVFEALKEKKFMIFKLQGRDKPVEDLFYRLSIILGNE